MKQIFFTPGPSELFFTVEEHIKNGLKKNIYSIKQEKYISKEGLPFDQYYGILYGGPGYPQGLGAIFYQAGIAVITASVFGTGSVPLGADIDLPHVVNFNPSHRGKLTQAVSSSFTGSTISSSCDAFRRRLVNLSFNNTTEINSKIYFCRVPHNKFNYSSNPTYVSSSKIVVKNQSTDNPVSYITTVGLYNDANQLVAVAKLSEPLKKDPTNDITLRVRLDY